MGVFDAANARLQGCGACTTDSAAQDRTTIREQIDHDAAISCAPTTSGAATARNHYADLLQGLSAMVTAPFAYLPPGTSLLVFPLAAANKWGLQSHLGTRGNPMLDLWSIPRIAPAARAAVTG